MRMSDTDVESLGTFGSLFLIIPAVRMLLPVADAAQGLAFALLVLVGVALTLQGACAVGIGALCHRRPAVRAGLWQAMWGLGFIAILVCVGWGRGLRDLGVAGSVLFLVGFYLEMRAVADWGPRHKRGRYAWRDLAIGAVAMCVALFAGG